MIRAHEQAAAGCRQAIEAGDGLAEDFKDHQKIAAELQVLAERHDRAALRLGATGPSTDGGTAPYAPDGEE